MQATTTLALQNYLMCGSDVVKVPSWSDWFDTCKISPFFVILQYRRGSKQSQDFRGSPSRLACIKQSLPDSCGNHGRVARLIQKTQPVILKPEGCIYICKVQNN